MDLDLKGRVALITGAGTGIGRGIATLLAAEGAQLVILARRRNLLESLADEICRTGAPRPLVLLADVADPETPGRARDQVLAQHGRMDILVNNAGGSQPAAIDEPDASWRRGFDVNFTALRKLAEAFVPAMRQNGYGRIINIGGTHEPIGINVTGAAKAAAQFWAKSLADEVARSGITVNTIVPGRIRNERMLKQYSTEEALRKLGESSPMGHIGEPEDIAGLAALLASPRARYITGVVIYVDGGQHRYAF